MRKSGPRNISIGNLMSYRFPVMAIASILHRISGFLLFLYIPFMLWLLEKTLSSPMSFAQLQQQLLGPVFRFFLWVLLSAAAFHVLAGIKHLTMDLGHLEEKCSARVASWLVIVLAFVAIILLGVWLWV